VISNLYESKSGKCTPHFTHPFIGVDVYYTTNKSSDNKIGTGDKTAGS
jgi:hypothetical protein